MSAAVVAEQKKKPLPEGYVCNACGAVGEHAIYECPLKKKGLKKSSGKNFEDNENDLIESKIDSEKEDEIVETVTKETHDASSTTTAAAAAAAAAAATQKEGNDNKPTAFISGLPFWFSRQKLLTLLEEKECNEDVAFRDVKIVTFEDNPRKCKGLAYVSCSTEAQLSTIINNLHGYSIDDKLKLHVVKSSSTYRNGAVSSTVTSNPWKRKKRRHKDGEEERHCYRCGGKHDPKDCTNERICYRCRGTGHLSNQCPYKKNKTSS